MNPKILYIQLHWIYNQPNMKKGKGKEVLWLYYRYIKPIIYHPRAML